ncbi:MAG: glycosyltransferase family 39 protein [Proteobacteria bacterium]|nr:glycosyltransferase family 39 protein [Pseudomonadota bacterium]MBI3498648.1 glycosyltransferase family 39 protein [Pseudomonadota bacterium]
MADRAAGTAAADGRFWGWAALGIVLALTLLRLAYLGLGRFDLYGDEAQYWTWAEAPAWGYFSKPPMVAWVIWLTTRLFGEDGLAVRMGSPLAHLGTSLVLYAIGARLYGRRIAFLAAITFATLPAIFLSSLLISTDPFLLFFWALALYAVVRAMDAAGSSWWLAAGIAVGLGTLSKYAMAMFPLSIALYLIATPEARRVAGLKRPLLALALALLLYAPNLRWNLENGLISYQHTAANADMHGLQLHPGAFAEFVLSQFLVFGPILFATLLLAMLRPRQLLREPAARLLLALILPMALMMLTVSMLSRANANWAAVVYVPGTLLVVNWLAERGREGVLRTSLLLHLAIGGVMLEFHDIARLAGIELTARTDPFRRLMGWQTIGDEVAVALAGSANAVLLVEDRMLLANLIYSVRPHPLDAVKWNPSRLIRDHYDLSTDIARVRNRPFLFVSPEPDPQKVLSRFERVEPLGLITAPIYPDLERRYWLFLLDGFKGYG